MPHETPGSSRSGKVSAAARMFARWAVPRARLLQRTSIIALRAVRLRRRWQRIVRPAITAVGREAQAALQVAAFVVPTRHATPPQEVAHPASPASTSTSLQPPKNARARVIANPVSGTLRTGNSMRDLERGIAWLTEHGLPTELSLTEYAGHATELAHEAVALGRNLVIAAGGDGTVNAVIQALAGHTTALGVIPLGTVNVWAREMDIPLNIHEACEVVLHGVRRRVDLGRAGKRYFLLMAGIGFDAEVAQIVEQSWLKRIGLKLLDYISTATRLSITSRPAQIRISRKEKRRDTHALMVIIGNTRLYGGALTFTVSAVADDGLLDLVIVQGDTLWSRARLFISAILHRRPDGPYVQYERARTVRLESNPPLPVQVDGELAGHLPMTFAVAPLALSVLVPDSAPRDLFMHPPEPAHR